MSLSDCIIDTCDHGHKFAKLDDHPGNSCVHCLRLGLASARAERDALAAHVEEGRQLARELLVDDKTNDATQLTDWALAPHETSLARLKAQWQAEVLYEFTHGSYVMPATLNLAMSKRAGELRRQAEGSET